MAMHGVVLRVVDILKAPSYAAGNSNFTLHNSAFLLITSNSTVMEQHGYQSYTVGLICSSTKVLAAAQSMLDRNHDFEGPTRDANPYHFGAIGERNVAITWLPDGESGYDSTCRVATNMRLTFGNLQVCLVLGIGSGFSNEGLDIQLGDVVVSKPTTDSVGLVMIGGHQTTLEPPSELLLSSACRLRRTYKDQGHGLSRHLQEMLQKRHRMKQRYSRPTTGDANRESPVIHYGCVASGNHVLENTKARDVLVQINGGILSHETNARGAMNEFPGCVHVIMG